MSMPCDDSPVEDCGRSFMTTCYALNIPGVPYCRKCEHIRQILSPPKPKTDGDDDSDPEAGWNAAWYLLMFPFLVTFTVIKDMLIVALIFFGQFSGRSNRK